MGWVELILDPPFNYADSLLGIPANYWQKIESQANEANMIVKGTIVSHPELFQPELLFRLSVKLLNAPPQSIGLFQSVFVQAGIIGRHIDLFILVLHAQNGDGSRNAS